MFLLTHILQRNNYLDDQRGRISKLKKDIDSVICNMLPLATQYSTYDDIFIVHDDDDDYADDDEV